MGGSWVADKFDGRGEVFFSTKDRYVGHFSAGCMHVTGVYSYSNGAQISGEWRQGIRQRKMGLSRSDANERFEAEVTASKECSELGDVKYNGKLISYFVTPARPELEQYLLEREVTPDSECNLLKGEAPPRKTSAALEEGTPDSPSVASASKARSTSFLG